MKLYNYQKFLESSFTDSSFTDSKKDIHSICKKYGIKNYSINEDGSIDVDGNVF